MVRHHTRWLFGVAVLLAVFGATVALNWQRVLFSIAVLSSEQRPSLFDDARWDHPESARKFQRRFAPGTSEIALLDWLRANDFTIQRTDRTARYRVRGLPCNELIEIGWQATDKGVIKNASAVVREAGCV